MNNAYKKEKRKFIIILVSLAVALLISFVLSMCIGRYSVSIGDTFKYLFGQPIEDVSFKVLNNLRLPRTLVAICVGCSLAISGTIYQSIFNNKLVSPDILGVSSGASVGACLGILIGFSTGLVSLFAFVFGFITVLLTLLISKAFKNKSNLIIILCGLAVGGLMSSLVGLMKYLADNEMKLAEMTFWLLGDLSKVTINDFWIAFPVTLVGCIIAVILSWRMNIVSLGKKESKALGVNYNVTTIILIIVATILTAVSVSISGTIGWIGLVIPNLVRLLIGNDNKKVVPVSMLFGAVFMVLCDMLARSIAPNEIPLSVITGIIGTPLFLFSIFKRRKEIE
jgi:iron complex transport system permease protein